MTESEIMEIALETREGSDFGGTLTYAGKQYPCSIGVLQFGSRLVNGGVSPDAETTIVVRKSVLPTGFNFDANKPLSVKDANDKTRSLKIAAEGITDAVYAWELVCNDLNQRA